MRAVVWIDERHWEVCIDEARRLPDDTDLTLLHVVPSDAEALPVHDAARLLGRRRPDPSPLSSYRTVAEDEAQALLADARSRLGRDARLDSRHGRVEREVVAACDGAQLLIMVRDGEQKLGPPSLARHARFVVDHAPCTVLLLWPTTPPGVETMPPPPPVPHPDPPG